MSVQPTSTPPRAPSGDHSASSGGGEGVGGEGVGREGAGRPAFDPASWDDPRYPSAPPRRPRVEIDRGRYVRVLVFFAGVFVHLLVFDFLLARPFLRALRPAPMPRWCRLARRYRNLAVKRGGVLIKLGQYLSARVDILPLEVTRELAGLQDEVPPEDFDVVRRQIEAELGRPLVEIFSTFLERPLGAASFAQVHEAQLPGGEPVVVKVLRPGLERVVETDLEAIARALGWVKILPAVRRRVDLDWLVREFRDTTLRELDLLAEGRHAQRFAENFAGQGDVHVPRIYWRQSSRRVLTEENVAFIKVTDLATLREYGIDPKRVARKLYRIYMQQIFEHHFVHCDPHPGNLFVRPLASASGLGGEMASRAGEALGLDDAASRLGLDDAVPETGPPFEIAFIDFGMVAEIPPRLRAALRKYLIGVGSRDAAAVIGALRDAGSILPGADLAQLEEAVDAIFDRFWGVDMSRVGEIAVAEAASLWREFGELLRDTPIQVQVDLMFAMRAVELLTGVTNALDPEFNPWVEMTPFAQRLAVESLLDWRLQGAEALRQARSVARLPAQVDKTLGLLQRGRLSVRTSLAADSRRALQRIERSNDRLSSTVASAALLMSGALLYPEPIGQGLMGGSALLFALSRLRRR